MNMTVFWAVAPCSLVEVTDVSEVFAASIIRALISKLLPDYTAQQPRKHTSSIFEPVCYRNLVAFL
jgi:hypothetical protein